MATNYSFARFIRDTQRAQAKVLGAQYPFSSSQPYQYDLEAAGLMLLVDYSWDYDDGRACVQITKVTLMGYDGSEYPLKSGAIHHKTWAEIESLIADEINDANDAAAQSLRDEE